MEANSKVKEIARRFCQGKTVEELEVLLALSRGMADWENSAVWIEVTKEAILEKMDKVLLGDKSEFEPKT